jgi:hypothetical protein
MLEFFDSAPPDSDRVDARLPQISARFRSAGCGSCRECASRLLRLFDMDREGRVEDLAEEDWLYLERLHRELHRRLAVPRMRV